MRIGINAVMLDGPPSGATRRIECLVRELSGLGHEAVLLRGKDLGIPWRPSIARAAAERLRLPARIKELRLDALEWSHLPLSVPSSPDGPKILLTVHDLRHLSIAQHSPFSRRFFAQRVLRAAIEKAHRVVVVSEFTRSELLRHLPVPEEKIVVIPNGADHIAPPSPAPPRKETILSVGHLEPRKNLGVLIDAFAMLVKKGFPHRLQIAGSGKGNHEQALRAQAESADVADRIDWLGPVTEDELPLLYASARLFAFPSLYEGFGIPLLEAMRCGTPVVAARAGALPEVGGEACIYADPNSTQDWSEAFESLLRDERRAGECVSRGRERADRFPWRESARLLAETASS